MSTYAWVDLCSVLVPFLFSFHPSIRFYANWRAFFLAALAMMALFVPWDASFTLARIWGFSPEHVWNARLFHLPIEEWLFFFCIPYCCVFSYHCFQVLGMKHLPGPFVRPISLVLVLGLLAVAVLNPDRAYSFTACTLCAMWVGFTAFVQKASWLGRFYLTYLILLIPFLIVNGVLTGTGPEREVVWYDSNAILGIRILTIPVEDIFYGMLMVGLTVSFYEALLTRRRQQKVVHEA